MTLGWLQTGTHRMSSTCRPPRPLVGKWEIPSGALNYLDKLAKAKQGGNQALLAQQAQLALAAGNYRQAESHLANLLKLKPWDEPTLQKHALAAEKVGQFSKAYDDYSHMITLRPWNAQLFLKRAAISQHQRHFDLAEADVAKAFGLNGNSAEAHYQRGLLSEDQGHFDQAVVDINHALRLDPSIPEARQKLQQLSKYRLVAHVSPAPRENAKVALPASASGLVAEGYNSWQSGDLDEAVRMFATAVKKSPDDVTARRYLAYVLLDRKNYAEAATQFRVLKLAGTLPAEDNMKFAGALLNSGQGRQAATILESRLAAVPEDTNTRVQLARYYLSVGAKPRAQELCLEGIRLSTSADDRRLFGSASGHQD